ncbi:MAG: preprotein translocase subunit SecG [Candidatus Abawacabacteria bacterium RBG_16_42_10]|uniref:Protein-export membrane protein SecG n=1 Tax=Candidatus Abawacabacteria bacterium RBG_16_42_10 TaxID=1817814 RepID=A0A1F4XLK0_9BACT|nr:MAG: preprotein translocase subunit SecG [Candidatus Abawacabacteria bacterium RBG_16_42_10]
MNLLKYLLIGNAVLLVLFVLLQSRGVGLSSTFGGDGAFYRTRRGPEKLLFNLTIFLTTTFALISLILPLWDSIVATLQ